MAAVRVPNERYLQINVRHHAADFCGKGLESVEAEDEIEIIVTKALKNGIIAVENPTGTRPGLVWRSARYVRAGPDDLVTHSCQPMTNCARRGYTVSNRVARYGAGGT